MKTEKEKMLSCELYDASDSELTKERAKAREIVYDFNNTKPGEHNYRCDLLKKLFGNIKSSICIEPPFHCDYGYNIEVGENFYVNFGCIFLDVNKIKIGDNVLIAPNVQLYTASHPVDPTVRLTFKELGFPITIGNNVWIGGGSIICPGVTIGNNVTIGAGSVVTKDIPDNVVAAGNPCRVIKKLYTDGLNII